jgi:hypothetical protein
MPLWKIFIQNIWRDNLKEISLKEN